MAPNPSPRSSQRLVSVRFPFAFDRLFRLPARLLGIGHDTAWVEVTTDHLEARFGRWVVRTPLHNVAGAQVSGPYSLPKVIGPAHLSFADRGLTFATNAHEGACITFREPVRGIDPLGLVRHPGLTVTVAEPQALVDALLAVGAQRTDVEEEREEQEVIDRLHGMTAAELRQLAKDEGISHASKMGKGDLVDLIERELGARLEDVVPEPEHTSS